MKIESAELARSAKQRERFVRDDRPEIAFVGRSNVGKSSLLNRLLSRKGLARTGSTPGRTQAVNYFLVNRRFYFVDLPGYCYARASHRDREQWARLMEDYLRRWTPRSMLLQLVDGKVGATDLDLQAHGYLSGLGIEPRVVATKIDKVPRSRRARQLASIRRRLELAEGEEPIALSATSGEGIDQLWKGIRAFLESSNEKPSTMGTT